MHWVDITILAIIGLSIITGLVRGFIKELIAFSAWALAIWLAFNHSELAATWLQAYIKDPTIRTVVSMIAVLIFTLFVSGIVNMVVGFFVKRSGLSSMDRLLGMGFGFARGIFIISLVLVVVKVTEIPAAPYTNASFLYVKFDPFVDWLAGRMPHFIQQVKEIDKQHNLLDLAIDVGDLELVEAPKKPLNQHIRG